VLHLRRRGGSDVISYDIARVDSSSDVRTDPRTNACASPGPDGRADPGADAYADPGADGRAAAGSHSRADPGADGYAARRCRWWCMPIDV
jgi:hypothetical protein